MNRQYDFDFDTGKFTNGYSTGFGPQQHSRRLPSYIIFVILVVALCVIGTAVSYLDVWVPQWFA